MTAGQPVENMADLWTVARRIVEDSDEPIPSSMVLDMAALLMAVGEVGEMAEDDMPDAMRRVLLQYNLAKE